MEKRKNLFEKMMKAQSELKAPKNLRNNFGKYNYRSCEGILEALKPLLKKHGLYVDMFDDIVTIGDRMYVKSIVRVRDIETGEEEHGQAFAGLEIEKKGMDFAQVVGSASSYARKYALNGMFLIDDSKDAESEEYANEQIANGKTSASIPSIDEAKVNTIQSMSKKAGVDESKILKKCAPKAKSFAEMTVEQFTKAMELLETQIERQSKRKED